MFFTHPCAAWGIGLIILVLGRLDFTPEELQCIHSKLMQRDMWTINKFRFRILGGNEEKFDQLFGIAAFLVAGMKTKVSINKTELIAMARESYSCLFQFILQNLELQGGDAIKVTVKVVETYLWCYNQVNPNPNPKLQPELWIWAVTDNTNCGGG